MSGGPSRGGCGSNDESTTACGVSSMMKSTPVRCSSARMLRPSRPMMRPLRSSEASSTTVTVASAVWLAATRWSASATRARARRRASDRASSSIWRTSRASSCRTRSFERSSSCWRASWTVSPEIFSSAVERLTLRVPELVLERLDVDLAISQPLLAPLELREPRVDLELLLERRAPRPSRSGRAGPVPRSRSRCGARRPARAPRPAPRAGPSRRPAVRPRGACRARHGRCARATATIREARPMLRRLRGRFR